MSRKALTKTELKLAKADPVLGRLINAVIQKGGPRNVSASDTAPFEALVRAIVYQSVSGKAAATIFARLKKSIGSPVRPVRVAAMTEASIAAAGLSKSKTRAVVNLARWFLANKSLAKALPNMPDDEVVAALTSIDGIGVWTANVFLIFNLGRPDVMPSNDLGIRRGVQLLSQSRSVATGAQVQERAQRWRPYRTIACLYLWTAVKMGMSARDTT